MVILASSLSRSERIRRRSISVASAFSVSPQPVAAEAAPGGGVPDDLSRSLRMLYLKGRIPSVEGRFYPIEGKTLTLANMGYFDQAMFDHHAFDAMVQAKIKFKSA